MNRNDHDGCAYQTVQCDQPRCNPAELCPGGSQVYRTQWGGHHHEDLNGAGKPGEVAPAPSGVTP